MSHAPEGMLLSGFTHGAQRSSAVQFACGNRSLYCATCGMHTLRHTPSASPSDLHDGGLNTPPARMNLSGTQEPPVQGARASDTPAGTRLPGTQCAPAEPGSAQQAGRLLGS